MNVNDPNAICPSGYMMLYSVAITSMHTTHRGINVDATSYDCCGECPVTNDFNITEPDGNVTVIKLQ